MYFISPTKGRLTLKQTVKDIIDYMEEDPKAQYKLIIGTDSQEKNSTCFVTAIIIHRLGKGARYYYRKKIMALIKNLRQRVYIETSLSLEAVNAIKSELASTNYKNMDVEVHVDIGHNGDTKELIREVVGWVMGSGFRVKIKPQAYGATKVADRFTK